MPSFDDFVSPGKIAVSKPQTKEGPHRKYVSKNTNADPSKQLHGKNKNVSDKTKRSLCSDLWVDKHKPLTQVGYK